MPDISEARGLLAKNASIREEMLRRKSTSVNDFFYILGKEEYQDTFSPNNKLEDVASLRFANLLSLNAYLNQDRFLEQKYITPKLTEFYGSNPQIDGNIGYFNIFNAHNGTYNRETGRIIDDYNEGVNSIEIKPDKTYDELQEENGSIYYLKQNVNKADKYNISVKRPTQLYDWFTPYEGGETDSEYKEYDFNLQIPYESYETIEQKDIPTLIKQEIGFTLINDGKRYSNKDLLSITRNLFDNRTLRDTSNTHTKNLKKKDSSDYCRNWAKHRKYGNSLKDLMGNLKTKDGIVVPFKDIQEGYKNFRAEQDSTYLTTNSVLQDSGFVNIVRRESKNNTDIYKKCMFSIENLAWKDVPEGLNYLSKEQRGPNGGRIMWFPPYDLSFSESVNINWNSNSFIGRGEKVFTYTDTDRTGTLSFTLLMDHPNILNETDKDAVSEDDVIRFFNGEQLLEAKTKIIEDDVDNRKRNNDTPEPNEVPNKESKQIKFTIYFPNNYSGMYLFDEDTSEAGFKNTYEDCLDSDWWLYILFGTNTRVIKWDESGWTQYGEETGVYDGEWRGYEIQCNRGLSVQGGESVHFAIDNNNNLNAWKTITEVNHGHEYHVRTDFDMAQKYENENSPYYSENGGTTMLNSYIMEGEQSNGVDFSAAEAITAIANFGGEKEKGNKYGILKAYVSGSATGNEGRIEEIVSYLKGYGITKIEIDSFASVNEGAEKTENVDAIALRRAYAVKKFLGDFLQTDVVPVIKTDKITPVNLDINSEEQKRARCVKVTISMEAVGNIKLSGTANGSSLNNEGHNYTQNTGLGEQEEKDSLPDSDKRNGEENEIKTGSSIRYENEAEYFKRIENSDDESDRMIASEIREKIKYFNPAFHSISPEGFNARLTFLQQCSRQGHTFEYSDKNGFATTAGNLAFGKMPVCVLTLGDFINSRILVGSMTINYSDDGIQWDLNKTGAGVQPMFAKVEMQITILGGQSLSGPVSRLQNAVSFNYYANTGVYDDRADRVTLGKSTDKDGDRIKYSETYDKIWAPYPKEDETEKQIIE